jgi:acyl-CoA dehydrogenase
MNFPGFRLPDELLALREQIRRVVRDEVIPVEQQIDPDAPELPEEDHQRIAAKTKAAGLWALGAPEQYGGGGLDTFSMCVALEEMSQHRMGLYNPGCGVFGRYPPPAIWAGSKEQIAKYALPTIRDGLKTFFAITEPSGGSDPAGAIQTRAEKRGDRWVLNGRKVFTSRAHDAPWGLVWARTDRAKGRGGISCFILERGTPGFTAKPIKVIRTSAIPNDVTLEDCEVPAENLVGAEGQGLDLAFDLLVKNRFPYSACNLGVAVAAHRMAIAHAKQRSTFGAPLSQRQAIQWMLADAEVELRAWTTASLSIDATLRSARGARLLVLAHRGTSKDTEGLAAVLAHTALPLLVTAAKEAPQDMAVQFHLALALEATGDKRQARTLLERVVASNASFDGQDDARRHLDRLQHD